MKHSKEICLGCDNLRYIVNKTHTLCQTCNRLRLDSQKTGSKKGTYTIKPVSDKQKKKLDEYRKTREAKRKDQIEGGYYKCYFCNDDLVDYNGRIDTHHTLGRDGDLLSKYSNLFFTHRICHTMYHSYDVKSLFKTSWYMDFLMRVRKLSDNVWEKEKRKIEKAGIQNIDELLDDHIKKLSKRKK